MADVCFPLCAVKRIVEFILHAIYFIVWPVLDAASFILYSSLAHFHLCKPPYPPVSTKKRAVLITGASSGIGERAAYDLAAAGFLVFTGVRNLDDGKILKANAGNLAYSIVPVILDVTKPETIKSARDFMSEHLKANGVTFWGLVNNAGVASPSTIEFASTSLYRQEFDVNVFGVISTTQVFLPMIRAAGGRIVNVGSMAGFVPVPGAGTYCATKYALDALTSTLRIELHPYNVSVSLLEPGMVETKIYGKMQKVLPNASSLQVYKHLLSPLKSFKSIVPKLSISPTFTSLAILHALTSRVPATRYKVGVDAWLYGWIRCCLSDRLFESQYVLMTPKQQQ